MHLTRPKSSKGRSRPVPTSFHTDWDDGHRGPASLDSPEPLRPGQAPKHEPGAPLNKYKVLPSIERKRSEVSPSVGGAMSNLSLGAATQRHDEAEVQTGCWREETGSEDGNPCPQGATFTKPGSRLLLAVRAPCGRRFEQHFDPTDTLLAVKARAEVTYETHYGDACIQTMDVPRRIFTNMDRTLEQCGILNRTLLCICQDDV